MANSYPTCTRRTQQPDAPNQLTARRPEHSVNIVPPDRTTLSALKVRIDRIEYDIDEILTLISPRERNPTAYEAARHLNATGHVQTDASSSRDSARGSTGSSPTFTNTDAGDLEVTRFTPSTDNSVGMMRTFNLDMGEVSPRKRKRRSKEEQKQTNAIRSRGACNECRSKKRQCKPEHTPSKPVAKKRRRGHPHSSCRSLDISPSNSTQEMPPLHVWTNDRRASLPSLNLASPDLNIFSGNRRAYGVHNPSSPSVSLADQPQASSSTDIHQDQPSMIPPGQSYPGPYLDVHQFPGAVPSQFVGTAWLTPYLPDPKVFHGHPLSPCVQGYIDSSEGYVNRSGFPTNIGPRLTEFNPYEVSNDDLLQLDDSRQVQEMRPPYHYGFYRDRSGISHSTHQTQDTTVLTCTQGFSCAPSESPRLSQARLQKSENANPKAPAENSPAHQAVDLHGILGLLPIGSSTDRSPLPLQPSGNPGFSRGFPTHSRGSSPENPGFDWDEDLVTP